MRMDNVMLAPHNANSSPAAWERVHWNTIRNLLDGLGHALIVDYAEIDQVNSMLNMAEHQRTVLITGAAGGIGRATVHLFCRTRLAGDRCGPRAVWSRSFPENGSVHPGRYLDRREPGRDLRPGAAFTDQPGCPGQQCRRPDRQAVLETTVEEWDAGDGIQPALGVPGRQSWPIPTQRLPAAGRSSMFLGACHCHLCQYCRLCRQQRRSAGADPRHGDRICPR